MEYVDGYLHRGLQMEAVLFTLIVLQLKEPQHNNANYGANPAFQMDYHAFKYQLAHLI